MTAGPLFMSSETVFQVGRVILRVGLEMAGHTVMTLLGLHSYS